MLRIQNLSIDCFDPLALSEFWLAALGWIRTYESEEEVALEPPVNDGSIEIPDLLFLKNPDSKVVKNRLHLCLRPDDQAAEVARLESLGARRIEIGQSETPGVTWIVMADPEGNEFCVLRARPATEQ